MTTQHDIVQQARTWLGTPFHHQARLKGKGCDCLGLIVGVTDQEAKVVADVSLYNAWVSVSSPADFKAKVERSMRQLQNNPTKISAFYQKPTLQYAA